MGLVFPNAGSELKPHVPWLVAITMFLMGASQDLLKLSGSLRNIRAIALSLVNSFLVIPLGSYALSVYLFSPQPSLFAGMMILSSSPTTLSSSIIWTRFSGGNTSLALILTVCSVVSSVLCLPTILEISLARKIDLPATDLLLDLLIVIILPSLIGQLSRGLMSRWCNIGRGISILGHGIILIMVFTAVSGSAPVFSTDIILPIGFAAILLNCSISLYTYFISRWVGLSKADGIAVLFASSQKTLTVGLMVSLMYFGPLTALPALVYHVLQQFTASAFSTSLRRRKTKDSFHGNSS